jgi:hypothetical protein
MRPVPPKAKTVPPGLEAEAAVLTGALIGYARVSTRDQNLDRQIDALTAAGCLRVFADKKSGKTSARPELEKALDFMWPGDTLVVASLDRLSRSLQDLVVVLVWCWNDETVTASQQSGGKDRPWGLRLSGAPASWISEVALPASALPFDTCPRCAGQLLPRYISGRVGRLRWLPRPAGWRRFAGGDQLV